MDRGFIHVRTPSDADNDRYRLTADFTIDPKHYQRTDNGYDEAAKVETVYAAIAEEGTDIPADNRTNNAQQYRHEETAAIIPRHDPLGEDTRDQTEDNP